jgi:hypothetical protein
MLLIACSGGGGVPLRLFHLQVLCRLIVLVSLHEWSASHSSQNDCGVALQLPAAGTPTFIDQVLTQQEYDTALAAARAGRCDRSFKFGRSNGHVGERNLNWLPRGCL